jgi:pimeloyl-ACP methyl ester carboxylesterase
MARFGNLVISHMKLRTKIVLGSILSLLLVGPFLIPVNSSGTQDNVAAANAQFGDRSKFVTALDHDVHYLSAGDPNSDRLILLLHGFGANVSTWDAVLEELGAAGFVIAYDRAAFGFTERPENWSGTNPYSSAGQLEVMQALIDEFGAGKEVVILGHSAGGNLAAAFAAKHPDQVDQLVLLDPAIYTSGGTPDWLTWIYDIPQLNHVGPALVSSIATSGLDLLDRSYFDKSLVTDELKAKYTAPLSIAGWEKAFWNFNKAPRATGVEQKLLSITMPTLVITGDNDEVVATADSVRLAGELPNAQLVVIENCGHLPNEEKPQEFLTAVAAFLFANQ